MAITLAIIHVWQREITASFLKYRVRVLNLNITKKETTYCHDFGKVSVGVFRSGVIPDTPFVIH